MNIREFVTLFFASCVLIACSTTSKVSKDNETLTDLVDWSNLPEGNMGSKLAKYTPFKLETDINALSDNQKKMIKILIEAGEYMNDMFWYEAYGEKEELLNLI